MYFQTNEILKAAKPHNLHAASLKPEACSLKHAAQRDKMDHFKLIHDDSRSKARIGKLITPRGQIDTPCFMPVGTQGTVKTLSVQDLKSCGAQIILSNAYHLFLRPGMEVIKNAGGLHNFMSWDKPILTDSGGYQIFSLALLRKVNENGVEFQSHIDGFRHLLTPEDVVRIQKDLGSDIMMVLDDCVHYPCEKDYAGIAMNRTIDWARRSKAAISRQVSAKRSSYYSGLSRGPPMKSCVKSVLID